MDGLTPSGKAIASNLEHIGKVDNVRSEVSQVNLKRKRSYEDNLEVIQTLKKLCKKAKTALTKRKDKNESVRTLLQGGMKNITKGTTKAKKSHRLLHAAIAKLGKAIDKNFEVDDFLSLPPDKMSDKEINQIRQHIDYAVTTHIAMAGANRTSSGSSSQSTNKYNKDSESTKINNNETECAKDFVAINLIGRHQQLWGNTPHPSHKTWDGKAYAKNTGKVISDSADTGDGVVRTIHQLYKELHSITTDLKAGKTESAITWTMSNVEYSDAVLDLEFRLRSLHYLHLLRQKDMDAAVRYSQAHFPKFVEKHGEAVQSLMACLLFPGASTSNLKYAQMQSKEAWQKNIQAFKKCYCKQHGLPLTSVLTSAVKVGVRAMGDIRKLQSILNSKSKSSMDDDANDTHEPEAYSWQALEELPINIDVGQEAQFHSIFTCPVSREQATESNPPMLLTCGHALCKNSMLLIARGRSRFKCPYCPHEIFGRDVVELRI